jgi:hypothetical protein
MAEAAAASRFPVAPAQAFRQKYWLGNRPTETRGQEGGKSASLAQYRQASKRRKARKAGAFQLLYALAHKPVVSVVEPRGRCPSAGQGSDLSSLAVNRSELCSRDVYHATLLQPSGRCVQLTAQVGLCTGEGLHSRSPCVPPHQHLKLVGVAEPTLRPMLSPRRGRAAPPANSRRSSKCVSISIGAHRRRLELDSCSASIRMRTQNGARLHGLGSGCGSGGPMERFCTQ